RRLHQRVLSGMKRGHGYNQLRQISQRRIEQPAYRIARLFGDGFSCMTKKGGERNDREDSENEQKRVSLRGDPCRDQYHWNKGQHPEQRGVPDFPEQRVHGIAGLSGATVVGGASVTRGRDTPPADLLSALQT